MRFLELVFWCGSGAQRSKLQSTASPQPLVEDEGSSVSLSPRTGHRKKQRRLASTAPEWRPSLGSISEDLIAQPRESVDTRNRKVEPEREVKRKNAAASKVHHRGYRDDHKRVAAATVMPVFSPTPFMF